MELRDRVKLLFREIGDEDLRADTVIDVVARHLGKLGGRPKKGVSKPVSEVSGESLNVRLRSGSDQKETEKSGELAVGSPVRLEFLTCGQSGRWALRQDHFDQYQAAFPGLNCELEFRKAQLWCVNNPPKRKTAKGMPRFLQSWLERAMGDRAALEPPPAVAATDNPVAAMMARAKAKWAGVK